MAEATKRVAVGSVWQWPNRRGWEHIRYRVAELGESSAGFPTVLLERIDRDDHRREWNNEAWLLNKLEEVYA